MIAGLIICALAPTRFPGDRPGTITIQDVSPREGRPNGVVTYHLNVINQHDKDVMSFTAKALVKRRD